MAEVTISIESVNSAHKTAGQILYEKWRAYQPPWHTKAWVSLETSKQCEWEYWAGEALDFAAKFLIGPTK